MSHPSQSVHTIGQRRYFIDRSALMPLPDLIEVQKKSYAWFLKEGLADLFDEISPISDFMGRDLELYLIDYYLSLIHISEPTRPY